MLSITVEGDKVLGLMGKTLDWPCSVCAVLGKAWQCEELPCD